MFQQKKETFFFESQFGITPQINGSQFTVTLSEPIAVPRNAQEVTVKIHSAEIWNTFPNIENGVNNVFYFEGLKNNVLQPFMITVPEGAYNVAGLNIVLQNQFSLYEVDDDFVTLEEFVEQGKVVMVMKNIGTIYRPLLSTISKVIGFTQEKTSISAGERFVADEIAQFNRVNKLFLQSTLLSVGIPYNGAPSKILAKIPISAVPGSQFNFQPFDAIEVYADSLRGSQMSTITFWLTDEQGRYVNTGGESWGFAMILSYKELPNYQLRSML